MQKLIIGNWKMHPAKATDAVKLFTTIKKGAGVLRHVEAVIAVPHIYIPLMAKLATKGVSLGAQDVSGEKEGPYTGEVSASMLAQYKVRHVIIGHSERRALGESPDLIAQKVRQVLAAGLTPVLCVGEKERDGGMWYLSEVQAQLESGFSLVPKTQLEKVIIAYEPVWAISSTENRKDATPEDFEEMSIYIRKVLADMFGAPKAHTIRVIYGGSVDEKNAAGFLQKGADGLLPGKASLTPKKFIAILTIANEIR